MNARLHETGERGAAAIIAAIMLMVVGGFLALALNVGHFMSVRGQLQNSVDAGALAGAESLSGTPEGLPLARTNAHDFAERHATDRIEVSIDANDGNAPEGDVVLGKWDFTQPGGGAFVPLADPYASPRDVNAVLVRAGREERRGNPLTVFFSAFLNHSTASVKAEAVALGGGTCGECSFPMVLAECLVLNEAGKVDCGTELVFTSATEDSIGMTNLMPGIAAVNPPTIIDILNGNCQRVQVGEEIGVGNGNNMNNHVIAAIQSFIDTYGPRVKVPIIRPTSCPDPQFNRRQPIVGFAHFTIVGLQDSPNRMIRIRLDCDTTEPDQGPAGCGFFGTPAQPRLVR